jgi:hypothetical protein
MGQSLDRQCQLMGRTLHFVHGHEVSPFLVVRPETSWQQVLPVGANVPCEHLDGIVRPGALSSLPCLGNGMGIPSIRRSWARRCRSSGQRRLEGVGQFESVPLRKQVLSCFAVDRG